MTPDQKSALVKAIEPITKRVRTDVTALKNPDGSSRWVAAPLSSAALLQHVNGGPPRGVCPIKEGQSVTLVALLDFDSHGGETDWPGMAEAAVKVSEVLHAHGYHTIPFRSSGGRGVHLYMLWDAPQDAYSVRMEMEAMLGLAGFTNGAHGVVAKEVEVFPKQDRVEVGEFGNQFILPLAGKSVPLDWVMGLEPMDRDDILTVKWPSSKPVPKYEQPSRSVALLSYNYEPIDKVKAALAAIPNDGLLGDPDYDEFRNIGFAVHEATGGSDEGYDALEQWAAQNPKHKPKFLRERVWDFMKDADKRTNSVTRATLFATAYKSGWVQGTSADGFDDEELEINLTAYAPYEGAPPPVVLSTEHEELDLFAASPELEAAGIPNEKPVVKPWPNFERDPKGKVLATIGNLVMAMRREDITGIRIGYDNFRDEIMLAKPGTAQWRAFGDDDYTWLRDRLERGGNGFAPIGKENVRDVVFAIANENSFDSAMLWLNGLPWDGVPRIEKFLCDHFGCDDTPYHRAVSLYWWTAMAGRVLEPGCQADMVPILVGHQGIHKSTAIKALVPSMDFFTEISFHESDDNLARKMRGRLVAEIGELRGMQTKEIEAIKQFVTRTHENWVPKFKEFATSFARRLIFVGTTNKEQFLADDTGNRRFLPATVVYVDVESIRRLAPQFWAEAREIFKASGIAYQEAEKLAEQEHEKYMFQDSWQPAVERWLEAPGFDKEDVPRGRSHLTTSEVLIGAMQYDPRSISRKEEMRMSAVLKDLGYIRRKVRVEDRTFWAFVPTSGEVGTEVGTEIYL